MSALAKTLIELQRFVQQSFLNVKEFCSTRTIFDAAGGSTSSYDLEQAIQCIGERISELQTSKQSDEEIEMYSSELQLLSQSADRLATILRMIKATETLRHIDSPDVAKTVLEHINADFHRHCEKYPFENEDIEYKTMHMVHAGLLSEVSCLLASIPPCESSFPIEWATRPKTEKSAVVGRALQEVDRLIEEPTLKLEEVNGIVEHEEFSSEKVISALSKLIESAEQSQNWLDAFKFEKCKVSSRVVKIMEIVRSLLKMIAQEQTVEDTHDYAEAIFNIVHAFISRAKPTNHHANDDIIYFNDCMFLLVEFEHHKFQFVYSAKQQISDCNFMDLLVVLRKSARLVLCDYLKFVKSEFLTWTSTALASFFDGKSNEFAEKLSRLDRFAQIWKDICSKNTYTAMIMIVCADFLLRTSKSLLEYKNFDDQTCCVASLLVHEIVDACNAHVEISTSEDPLYKSAVERLSAVVFCLEPSEFDITREWKNVHGRLLSILTEDEVRHLSTRYAKE